jgi:putative ABC transport system ATP-binding protein
MLRSEGLQFSYKSGPTLSLPDVRLAEGDQALVLGPSGSGKSTLLGLWSGLLSPKQGTIQVGETEVHALTGRDRDHWRARHVGIVYQRPRLIESQSVFNNIALQSKLSGKPVDRAAILADMEGLQIAHLADRYPSDCSVGEQQRVGILRALVHAPQLILADEPTSALDTKNALAVADLLQQQAKLRGATLAVVTHDDRLRPLFSRTVELN